MNESSKEVDLVALFDGECMMCNKFIRILDRAGRGSCRSLIVTPNSQTFVDLAGNRIDKQTVDVQSTKTILVCVIGADKAVEARSRAVARLMSATKDRRLRVLSRIIEITPRWISDIAYDIISKHRRRMSVNSCGLMKLKWIRVYE